MIMHKLPWWKWTKRAFLLATSLLIFAAALGAAYEAFASHRDARLTPPGRLIDVGGYRIHLYCEGRGSPTVIVVPGVGVWSLQWRKIQDALAEDTRICTYDREGYGWSDLGPSAPTAEQASNELQVLLENAGEQGPYLLVGESYGGYVTRLFVQSRRANVAGIVLVESAHERQWDEIPAAKALALQGQQQLRVAQWLTRIGFFRFWPMDRGEDLPVEVRRGLIATQARTQSLLAFENELAGAFVSAQQVAETHSLGDLPLVVVSAAHSFDKFFPAAATRETGPMNQTWMRLQDELTKLSTCSLHLVNQTATHAIAREQPEYVIGAIKSALQLIADSTARRIGT